MLSFRTVELAFRRFQTRREPRALAFVFDRTANDLLALARHLAPPGTEPEDLVQATFVTAIEAAGSHRTGERVLPWLCGILGNHARVARRRARRPVDAERLPHPVGDAAHDAEAAELRSELQAAIDRLPEVYRPVLRLVFAHGLQAHEVAAALERPAGTVRAQVTRGLELLRRTLPASLAGSMAVAVASGRGLAAVRATVLGAAGGKGIAAVSPWLIGGWIVLHHKFLAAAAAAVAALSLLWFLHEPPPLAAPPQPIGQAPTPAAAPVDAPALPTPERDAVAEAPAAAAADGAATGTEAGAAGRLVVRVQSADGTPRPGVGVAVFAFADLQDFGRPMDHVATDAHGTARFELRTADDWAIDVDRVGMAGVVHVAPGTEVERDVTLPAGVRIAGRVVDPRGAPVTGAEVVLHGSRAGAIVVARSDAGGAFTVADLPAGVELQARAPGRVASLAHPVRGAVGATTALELVLGDAAGTVRGIVRDAEGRPVADATVAILPASAAVIAGPPNPAEPQVRARWCRTAADGTFACDEVAAARQVVFAQRLPSAPAWVEVDAAPGTAHVELHLPRGGTLAGSVRRGAEPVAGATVLSWPVTEAPIGYLLNLFGMRHTQSAADGTFRIDGIVPGAHSVRLMQHTTMLRQETVELSDGAVATRHFDLAVAANLRVVVRSDRPLGAQPLLVLAYRNPLRDGEPPSMVAIRGDGTGELQLPRDGALDVILCTMPGGMSMLQLAAVRAVPPHQAEVVFELRPEQLPRRAITGRLVDHERAPLAGRALIAARADGDGLVVRLDGTTGADGSFVLGPLPAGKYDLYEGPEARLRLLGHAVLTTDRDEPVGDLVAPAR